ncbi:YwqI/YxiC family protein [Cytobacillus purgationiresistens]|uniref:Cell division protein ZapA (FtsZ GTPase activity inhibitor) n=1 Tax=Cytobacillus purgationiresistens TaxID=863449 RepID=A0ABU0ARB4_9BACI|nr:YwqI/YxiC family protein [Cytobacillus purgationiresistens]MDQ0273322.1 cell division protein ZapA (FtsZ GTPase activity inhibitor) [Cytobacillus purgationiresistens]
MSSEIKILKNDVDEALSKLQSSTNALTTSLPASIGSNNVLDTVKKMNQLNQALNQVAEAYKALLQQNEESTRQSVEFMAEADKQISSFIKMQ